MGSKNIKPVDRGISHDRLTDQQRSFVHFYLASPKRNAAEAARLAGYSAPNAGSKLIKNPLINKAIGVEMKAREERTKIKADRVILEYASVGFANIQDVMDEDGNYLLPHQLPRHVAAAVYSVEWRVVRDPITREVIKREVSNYIFWDKMNALAMMAKHLGMLDGKTGDSEGVSVNTLLSSVLQRMQTKSPIVNDEVIEGEFAALEDHSQETESQDESTGIS